jgi:iron complex outermembrane recepter protein
VKKCSRILLVLSLMLLFPIASPAAEEEKEKAGTPEQFQMGEVEVKAQKEQPFVEYKKGEPATQAIIPRKTIDTLAGPAQVSPFKALDLLPSVHSENSDAYGTICEQNNIRIRGQYGDTFTRLSRTIEGIPVAANVGSAFFGSPIDLEDLTEISFTRGAVPSDKGFGFGNAAGALDQSIQWSSAKFGATLHQSNGTENFNRTFLRIDSGELPSKTNLFVSGSTMSLDKWRGSGDGKRDNVSLGIVQKFPSEIQVSFFGAHNDLKQDAYRPLTYAQASDSSNLRGFDYNGSRTGSTLEDRLYYDYNRQKFAENLGILSVEYKPTSASYLNFKPYYYKADGYRLFDNGNATASGAAIGRNNFYQEQYGALMEYGMKIGPTLAKLGYWYQSMNTMPPASDQKYYTVGPNGLVFKNWSNISRVGDRRFHEPYLMFNNTFNKLRVDAGIKYVQIGLPATTTYNTTGVPNVSYDDVFSYTS